jgi:thiol-disulfide isomerase/thioredoxin
MIKNNNKNKINNNCPNCQDLQNKYNELYNKFVSQERERKRKIYQKIYYEMNKDIKKIERDKLKQILKNNNMINKIDDQTENIIVKF